MDKRKGIILAIVLFLIIGLGTFVFAGGSEDEGSGNGTITPQPDGGDNNDPTNPSDTNEEINDGNLTGEGGTEKPSRDDVTTPVVDEVETPVTDGNNANTIDWASLLNKLAQMVNTAEDREDIEAAIEFRKNNNITVENIESLGESAIDSLKIVNAILDDETAPAIEPDLDKNFFKEVSISINDDTKYTFVLERLDGESIPEGTTLDNINLEGEYKLTVVDAAFNETVVTFTIDRNETEETKTTMDVANATHFDSIEDAVATITDLSLDKVVVENQDTKESVTFVAENGNVEIKLTEKATYKLTAYDKAGNETTYWLAVDETDPTIFFTDSKGNELSDLTNKDVTITAFDKFLTEVIIADANGNETVYKEFTTDGNNENKTFTLTLSEDGIYTVTAKDKVGRTTTETIEIDETKIEVNHLYVLNNSHNEMNYNGEDKYQVIGIGQDLYVEYVLKEEFATTPILTIGGKTYEMTCNTASWNDELYKCDVHVTISTDMSLTNNKVIPFTITGVKDAAGNETIVTEENVTSTEKYGQVKFDGKAPKYNKLGILNVDHLRSGEDVTVINLGEEIRVLFNFSEILGVNPKMTIGESKTIYELKLTENYDNFAKYTYVADIKINKDMNLANGDLVYTIFGYADAAGNVGKTIHSTDSDIKTYSQYPGVKYDTTAPNIELIGEDKVYIKQNEKYEDLGVNISDNISDNIVPTYIIEYSETGEDGTFTTVGTTLDSIDTTKEGQYNVWYYATDAAGNTSPVRRIVVVKSLEPIASGIYGGNKVDDTFYANDDATIYINFQFSEKLVVSPKVDINGEFIFQYGDPVEKENANGEKYYIYSKAIKVGDYNFGEGKLSFRIYDYEDIYGIVGDDITHEDLIENGYQNGQIVIDNIPAKLEFVGEDETYNNILRVESGTEITLEYVSATATDANFKEDLKVKPYYAIFFNNVDPSVEYDFSNGFDTKKPTGNRYHVYYKVEDYAGNVTEGEMLIVMSDTTPATITPNQEDNLHVEMGSEYSHVTATVIDNVDGTKIIEPWEYIRFDFQLNNTFEVYKNINTLIPGKYLAIWDYTDSSGNPSTTLKRWVNVTDTTAPIIKGVSSNTTYFTSIPYIMTDETGIETIYYNYGGNYQSCDELISKATAYEKVPVYGAKEYSSASNGQPFTYPSNETGISVCVVDTLGNKTFLNNISYYTSESAENLVSAINNGGTIILPENTNINLNGSIDVKSDTTIIGNETSKLIGSLNLIGSNITLKNVNIENNNSTVIVSDNTENIVIDGGSYLTHKESDDRNAQGQGTIRIGNIDGNSYNDSVVIKNTKLLGGIHLLNYNGSIDQIIDNSITLENVEGNPFIAIAIYSNSGNYNHEDLVYLKSNNDISMNYYANTTNYYARIETTTWEEIDRLIVES